MSSRKYTRSHYGSNGTTAIMMWTDNWIPYAHATINLEAYGLIPEDEDHVFVPLYKLGEELTKQIVEDLVEKVVSIVHFGYMNKCEALFVRLKSNWKDMCVEEQA